MNVVASIAPAPTPSASRLELGTFNNGSSPLYLDLQKVLAGRLLVQGSSGAGKSTLLRRIVEEAFDYLTVMIVDPEGEFANLAVHIGATTLRATELSAEGLTAAAVRGRKHRLPLHLDLTDLPPDERISKAAAFFAGLLSCPHEDWANTVLVAIDEAHLLAPHLAASARDAETRRLGVATLTDLCARGRKRGIASVVATQRLAKLASSVISELHNGLIGLNIFDRDVARAADFLGYTNDQAQGLRTLAPGEFYAIGPALSRRPVLAQIGETITTHTGATPEILGPADTSAEEAGQLLNLDALRETGGRRREVAKIAGRGVLDAFLLDPAAAPAVRIIDALRVIAPNATTSDDLVRHLGLEQETVDSALDLLLALGAVDTMPRSEGRIARLSPRLRLRCVDTPVVGLA
ncbi:MAG: helicase HerA domain-containing protein [Caulobacteraceae bacterium]